MGSQTQSCLIHKSGALVGGTVRYVAHLETGVLTFEGEVTAKVLFISHTVPFGNLKNPYMVDPRDLFSTALDAVGKSIQAGPAKITVIEAIAPGEVKVRIEVAGQDKLKRCEATIDVSGIYIRLIAAVASAEVPILGVVSLQLTETLQFTARRPLTLLGRLYARWLF